nr:aminotransferase class V-fold PLP-dependent enzyme [Acuticoccus mangrovi]
MNAMAERVRARAADYLGADPCEIGFAGSVADGVAIAAANAGFEAGDRVVVARHEFPSVAVPLAMRSDVALVEARNPDCAAFTEAIEATPGGPVRVIAVSYVSYVDGRRVDLAAFRRLADALGAALWVDFTQCSGVLPVDLAITDFAFSSCYKWLLGTTSAAVCYWNRTRRPDWRPRASGWGGLVHNAPFKLDDAALRARDDAGVFTRGNPAHLALMILENALDFLGRFDALALAAHVQDLTTSLILGLGEMGLAVTTPAERECHGASVCIRHPDPPAVVARLAQDGVLAWGGHGRVRFSFHGYNHAGDVARALRAMAALA